LSKSFIYYLDQVQGEHWVSGMESVWAAVLEVIRESVDVG